MATSKRFAIKKVIRNPDGTVSVRYFDSLTGKPVSDLSGYNIIQSDNVVAPTPTKNINVQDKTEKQEPTNVQRVTGDRPGGPETSSTTDPGVIGLETSYIDKPGWMNYVGFVPGPIGTLGKVANIGINANNLAATNDQRTGLGFSDRNFGQTLGGLLNDKDGYIGEAAVTKDNGQVAVAPVSFSGEDKSGRTAYTPNEARMRNELMDDDKFTEATKQQKDEAIENFKDQNPDVNKGFLSGLADAVKGLFGGLGGDVVSSGGGSSGGNVNSFPDAPDAPDNKDTPSTDGGKPDVDTSGFTPGLW